MRYGIISDIHSNIQALRAALKELRKHNVDQIICLGDVVGYNGNPRECIATIKRNKKISLCLMGNHDEVVSYDPLRPYHLAPMSRDAVMGVKFSSAHTTAADKKWLGGLTREKVIRDSKLSFLVVHGFPTDNPAGADCYDYVLDSFSAGVVFEALEKRYKVRVCLFGHSHMPTMSRKEDKNKTIFFDMHRPYLKGNLYDLNHEDWDANALMNISDVKKGARYLFNAGAIGQPRHKNKVGFGILDTDAMTYEYVDFDYDIEAAMNAIKEANGSIRVAQRLWIDTPRKEQDKTELPF